MSAEAAVALAEAQGVAPTTVERVQKDRVKEVVVKATDMAQAEGKATPDKANIDQAARAVAAEHKSMGTKRQAIKKALMDNRGLVDFKAISTDEVDEAIKSIEMSMSLAEAAGDPYADWDEAVKDFIDNDARKQAEAKAAAASGRAMQEGKVKFSDGFRRAQSGIDLMTATTKVTLKKTGIDALAQESYLHRIDGLMADLVVLKKLIGDLSNPVDLDAELADLLAGK